MRFIPLLIILTVSSCFGLYILSSVTEFEKRHFEFVSLVYLTFLGMILFTPISFDGASVYVMQAGLGRVNLHQLNVLELGFFENIVLTVPLGFLIKKYFNNLSIASTAFFGFFIGGAIETTQYILSHIFLINRTSDINDVIANALGIVIGAILMVVYNYLSHRSVVESK
ncbi:VanZ family protein [Companilactobacillus sp. HBUAS59544]|uniref:VanZ family protein n=1 Tax=Companilactobacillus sp. HBUAS59544 TaxID=3109363 RepID=UPI002FF06E39